MYSLVSPQDMSSNYIVLPASFPPSTLAAGGCSVQVPPFLSAVFTIPAHQLALPTYMGSNEAMWSAQQDSCGAI